MPTYFKSRTAAVRFVNGKLKSLKLNSVATMIILRDRSGVFSVITATGELSEDTGLPPNSSYPHTIISTKTIPDG